MLIIKTKSPPLNPELYILEHIFVNLLSIEYRTIFDPNLQEDIYLLKFEHSQKSLVLPRIFFDLYSKFPFKKESLPELPLLKMDFDWLYSQGLLVERGVPLIYSIKNVDFYRLNDDDHIFLKLDIFGSIFFMISRYEEEVILERDFHNRFSAYSSIAYKADFLYRPICDEYLIILFNYLKQLDPTIKNRNYKYNFYLTCDIDTPYESSTKSTINFIKKLNYDLVKCKNPKNFLKTILNFFFTKLNVYHFDNYDTFDWMIKESKLYLDNPIVFYFLIDLIESSHNGNYKIFESRIIKLLRKIHLNGGLIGSHGSYDSFNNVELWNREIDLLKQVLGNEKVEFSVLHVRQHYLRWNSTTLLNFRNNDVQYLDSTLGFADMPGFRCGTCFDYPIFSFKSNCALNVMERPLIVMENTILSKSYLGLTNIDFAFEEIKRYSDNCKKVSGNFTLLWHNSTLQSSDERKLFQRCLRELI